MSREIFEMVPALAVLRKDRPRVVADFERALDIARRFRRGFVESNALAIDHRASHDPTYVPTHAIRAAAEHGLFTMMVPRFFGGQGLSLGAFTVALEEISAGCVGLANLVAVHGLALSTVASTGNLQAFGQVCRTLARSEKAGEPALLSTAITEPTAGTDVEDRDLLRTARLTCEARRVSKGYMLRGSKVFISNGSIARTHVVMMPVDRKRPVGTMHAFLVDADTPGLRVGRVERKMGQKACPAAELVFDECFVPIERKISVRPLTHRSLELVLGATRAGVGAFATGVARGAYERALAHVRTKHLGRRLLFDEQWVQFRLSDMYRNVMIARASYMEAMWSNGLFGLASLVESGGLESVTRHVPSAWLDGEVARRVLDLETVRKGVRKAVDEMPRRHVDLSSGFGAAAKITATDLAMANCHEAVELMGTDGLRHDRGMEKLFRDAKLLQIYEGTNQLNRIEVFKKMVAHDLAADEIAADEAPLVAAGPTSLRLAGEA